MESCRIFTIGIYAVLFWGAFDAVAMDEASEEECKRLRDEVLRAATGDAAGKAYANFFTRCGIDEDLAFDKNMSIALQADFQRRAVIKAVAFKDRENLPRQVLQSPDRDRFFGFFEGRTGLRIPDFWQSGKEFPDRYGLRHDCCPQGPNVGLDFCKFR